VKAATPRPKITVTADRDGVVSHAGSCPLSDVATADGLDGRFAEVVGSGRVRRSAHDPGRVSSDLGVLLADGAGAAKTWLRHLHTLRHPINDDTRTSSTTSAGHGLELDYSVGFTMTEAVQAAI
jgi:hypothetical protein